MIQKINDPTHNRCETRPSSLSVEDFSIRRWTDILVRGDVVILL